ncbi:MAG: hypothetical protein VX420_05060 [SAR324 cluster bacterium]|nr:hypothetical protein [SAR324 cluster bacterium]
MLRHCYRSTLQRLIWCVDILRLLILVLAPGYVLLLPNLLYH